MSAIKLHLISIQENKTIGLNNNRPSTTLHIDTKREKSHDGQNFIKDRLKRFLFTRGRRKKQGFRGVGSSFF